jgi:hypothetical protein
LSLTQDEYDNIKEKLLARQADPKNYTIILSNCATLVQEILGSRASIDELFPLERRLQSLAGIYTKLFDEFGYE